MFRWFSDYARSGLLTAAVTMIVVTAMIFLYRLHQDRVIAEAELEAEKVRLEDERLRLAEANRAEEFRLEEQWRRSVASSASSSCSSAQKESERLESFIRQIHMLSESASAELEGIKADVHNICRHPEPDMTSATDYCGH